MFYVRIAWRNLWRNKRRTLIVSASVFFAVIFSVAMYSMKTGQFEYLIHSAVSFSTGHIQIHGLKYWEKRSLDESMELDSALLLKVRALPHVVVATPRFETAALVSKGAATKVSPVIGIDARGENAMNGLRKRIVRGVALADWNEGALVAEGLARRLGAELGDSILIYGQGYEGVTAAALVPVVGIVHFPAEPMNSAMIYLPLGQAEDLFAAEGRVTSIAILLESEGALERVDAELRSIAGPGREVMTWREMAPELVEGISASKGAMFIMLLILYVIVGFGIFGTVMMMTAERTREFGMTIAIGMKRGRLMIITAIEALVVSMIGAISGIAVSIPIILYLHAYPIRMSGDYAATMIAYGIEPILPTSTAPVVFFIQGIVVFTLGVISTLYPLLVLRSLEPVQAMRG